MRASWMVVLALALAGCGRSATEEPRPSSPAQAQLPTPAPVLQRYILALDGSTDVTWCDPAGTRSSALAGFIAAQRVATPSAEIAVMTFVSGDITWLTAGGRAAFQRIAEVSDADVAAIQNELLIVSTHDQTDLAPPIAAIHALVSDDEARLAAGAHVRYDAFFLLAAALPDTSTDPPIAQAHALAALSTPTAVVQLNTAFLFEPSPVPDMDCAHAGPCISGIVGGDKFLLQQMAAIGGGQFLDFELGAPVSFDGI